MASTLASRIAQALSTNAGRTVQHDLYHEFYSFPPAARVAIRNEIIKQLPKDLVKSIESEFSRPAVNPTKHILVAIGLGLGVGHFWFSAHTDNVNRAEEYYANLNK